MGARVKEQSCSAQIIASKLKEHPLVERVYYPGLPSHPGHELACKALQGGFGGILSFELKGDYTFAEKVTASTKLFARAVSVGAVESLIEQPASMSHGSYDREARLFWGINDGLIRLSVGLEDVEDLWEDLEASILKSQNVDVDVGLAPQNVNVDEVRI